MTSPSPSSSPSPSPSNSNSNSNSPSPSNSPQSRFAPLIPAIGALLAGLAVATGAFGAHGLKAILTDTQLGWWDKAVHYHLIHAVALVACGLAWHRLPPGRPARATALAAALFIAGIALFSGSLYAMALTEVRALGAVTPFGGIAFIAAWIALAVGCWPRPASRARPQ